jgi:hypothetical protein
MATLWTTPSHPVYLHGPRLDHQRAVGVFQHFAARASLFFHHSVAMRACSRLVPLKHDAPTTRLRWTVNLLEQVFVLHVVSKATSLQATWKVTCLAESFFFEGRLNSRPPRVVGSPTASLTKAQAPTRKGQIANHAAFTIQPGRFLTVYLPGRVPRSSSRRLSGAAFEARSSI